MEVTNRLRIMPRHLVCWRGAALLIANDQGQVASGLEGFYYRQTRFLSRLWLTVDGQPPRPVSANLVHPRAMLAYFLAPSPAGAAGGPSSERDKGGGEIVRRGIEVQISRSIGEAGFRQDCRVVNHTLSETRVELRFEMASDFADLSEADSGQRQQCAPVEVSWRPATEEARDAELRLRYLHPQLKHACVVRCGGDGIGIAGSVRHEGDGVVVWTPTLEPQHPAQFVLEFAPLFCGEAAAGARVAPPENTGACRVRVTAASPSVQTAFDRAVADLDALALLDGVGDERRTPAAGIPRYTALFGRDTLVAGCQAGLIAPAMLGGTIKLVAKWNATEYDDRHDAQPGRVIHQHQQSPLALLQKNPFLHYYGDYSAPGWFLIACAWHLAITGDRAFYRAMRDKILATLAWMDRDGDLDGDGLYEYTTRAGDWGLKNQGWKDSEEAILYPDGEVVPNPLALVEIQGCYYAAKQLTGLAFADIGENARAMELLEQAADLKRRFNTAFWLPDDKFFALAIDPDKKPVRTIAGDAGQCLLYGVVDDDKAAAVADRLMSPELFSGWGIRTLSNRHKAFNPLAYHLGSVWPVANAAIGFGFKRYGFDRHLQRVAKAMFDASELFEYGRLPEVIGGHERDALHPHPGIYPDANAPQAWSASAVVLLVQAMLGLVPMASQRMLIIDPALPDWLPAVTLSDLRIGDARVSLDFRRDANGHTEHRVVALDGTLCVHRVAFADCGGSGGRLETLARQLYGLA